MSTQEATVQNGVSAAEEAALAAAVATPADEENDGQRTLSPRDEKLARVAENRRAEEQKERQDAVDQGLALPPKGEGEGGEDNIPAASLPAGVLIKDGKWFTKIKVNGVEKVVPFDEVIRTAQKHEAADVRLQQASQVLSEAERLRQSAVEAAQAAAKKEKQPSDTDAAVDPEKVTKVEEAFGELVEGDPKKAARMLADVLVLGRDQVATPAPAADALTPDKVFQIIAQHEDRKAKEAAVSDYRKKHPDLAGNKLLNDMVDDHSMALLNDESFQYESYHELMDEAVNRTRKSIADQAKKTQPPGVTTREQRKADVATAGVGTLARKPPPQQPQPKTREQILQEQRAARGRR